MMTFPHAPDIDVHSLEGLSARGGLDESRATPPHVDLGPRLSSDVSEETPSDTFHPLLDFEGFSCSVQPHKHLVLYIVWLRGEGGGREGRREEGGGREGGRREGRRKEGGRREEGGGREEGGRREEGKEGGGREGGRKGRREEGGRREGERRERKEEGGRGSRREGGGRREVEGWEEGRRGTGMYSVHVHARVFGKSRRETRYV